MNLPVERDVAAVFPFPLLLDVCIEKYLYSFQRHEQVTYER